jgi:hypothetical protein
MCISNRQETANTLLNDDTASVLIVLSDLLSESTYTIYFAGYVAAIVALYHNRASQVFVINEFMQGVFHAIVTICFENVDLCPVLYEGLLAKKCMLLTGLYPVLDVA